MDAEAFKMLHHLQQQETQHYTWVKSVVARRRSSLDKNNNITLLSIFPQNKSVLLKKLWELSFCPCGAKEDSVKLSQNHKLNAKSTEGGG